MPDEKAVPTTLPVSGQDPQVSPPPPDDVDNPLQETNYGLSPTTFTEKTNTGSTSEAG